MVVGDVTITYKGYKLPITMAVHDEFLADELSLESQHLVTDPAERAKEDVVHIGACWDQWRSIGVSRGLQSDADIASFLLQVYRDRQSKETPAPCCVRCQTPLTLHCLRCFSSGAAGNTLSSVSSLIFSPASVRIDSTQIGVEPFTRNLTTGKKEPSQQKKTSDSNGLFKSNRKEYARQTGISADTNEDKDSEIKAKCNASSKDSAQDHAGDDDFKTEPGCDSPHSINGGIDDEGFCSAPQTRYSDRDHMKCLMCSELLTDPASLTLHMHSHLADMTHLCDVCGAAFILGEVLERHKQTQKHSDFEASYIFPCSASAEQNKIAVHIEQKDHGSFANDESAHPVEKGEILVHADKPVKSLKPDTDIYDGDTDIEYESEADVKPFSGIEPLQKSCNNKSDIKFGQFVDEKIQSDGSVQLSEITDSNQLCETVRREVVDKHKLKQTDGCYGCQVCGLVYQSLDSLVMHANSHYMDSSLNCAAYINNFSSPNPLKASQSGGNDVSVVLSKICLQHNMEVATADQLAEHVQQKHSPKGRSVRTKTTGKKGQSVSAKLGHLCDVCLTNFSTAEQLQHHKRTEHKKRRRFQCGHCGKELCNMQTLITHERTHTGAKPFQCPECPSTFRSSSNLRAHMRTHTGHTPYLCPQCGRGFKEITHLKRHLVSHSGEKPHQCHLCDKAYVHATSLKEHMQSHTSCPKSWVCHQCGKAFANSKKLKVHLKIHIDKGPNKPKTANGKCFTCQVCGATYQQASSLSRHKKLHEIGSPPYVCSDCGRAFRDKYELKKHTRIHSGLSPHQCLQCPRSFSDTSSYKRHLLSHSGLKPHVCPQCQKGYADVKALKYHMQMHAGVWPRACTQCSKQFFTPWTLRMHVRHHAENKSCISSPKEKSHVCNQCGASYMRASSLVRHLRLHDSVQGQNGRYQCTQCSRFFGDSSHLKRHLLSHSGEKPFVCASCGKAYADSHTLKDHMQVHTGIRSFVCEVCGKAFFSAKTLKEHARSHSDQRPFQCSQCTATYKHLSGLISHKRLHSGLRPFICGECNKTFKDYSCYKRHLLTHSHQKPHVCQQCGKAYKDLKNLRHHQVHLHGNNTSS